MTSRPAAAMILVAGALLGLVSVAFGAYAEHALRAGLSGAVFDSVQTAIRFNQIHAVVVAAIGLVLVRADAAPYPASLGWSAWGFVAGTVLFSFSVYLSALTGVSALNAAAPVGGTLLMASWALLAWAGFRSARS